MADVTFIVGNGLDLSLGLETSYKHFYNHVQKNSLHPKSKIYGAIKNDPDTWANFERTLGVYTQFIEDLPEKDRKKASMAFHDDLEDVTQDLADYLEVQDKKSGTVASRIRLSRSHIFEELSVGQRDKIRSLLSTKSVVMDFVTLNYTYTLERVFPNLGRLIVPDNIVVENIHHVHGDLTENVTLGVSDESQLSSALEGDEKNDLIKPRIIESMNDGRINKMKQIIRRSSVVILYGTSIGETDKYIWEFLIEWLEGHPDRHLVVHKHDSTYTDATKRIQRRRKLFVGEVQNTLLSYAELDEETKTELRNRIFVIHNTKKLFRPSSD